MRSRQALWISGAWGWARVGMMGSTLAAACLHPRVAHADKVALVAARGGATPEEDRAVDAHVAAAVTALGHTVVQDGAEWIVTATQDPAVTSYRLELGANLVPATRFESVAREIDRSDAARQTHEMLAVLLRREGVGTGAMPWENAPPKAKGPAPPESPAPSTARAEPPEAAVPEGKTRMAYLAESSDVESIYSGDHPFFVGGSLGVDALVLRPEAARGAPASMIGTVRGGGAIPGTGLEIFAELGGHLVNAPAVYFGGGARYMFSPFASGDHGFPLHFGPSLRFDGYVVLGRTVTVGTTVTETPAEVAPSLVGSAEIALGVFPWLTLDAQLGELRWVGLSSGDVLSLGAALGASARF